MNCKQMETLLIAALDGSAREEERREIEAHLGACAVCRARAQEFRRVWSLLDEMPVIEPSLGFDARLRQRIAAEPRPRWLAGWVPPPRLAFAVSLLLLLSVWVSRVPPVPLKAPAGTTAQVEEDFKVIENLQVLEDYDVIVNFEALAELPAAPSAQKPDREL